ncbi:SRPBCC family protein [Polyangium jinanense]|uniref:SRPBCC family protein n=1 Tax=Polyangium jinanense TaxID=2829994 RepID=A0A9X3X9I3_9BACT|nr:SRPBCC family protein [Polyangium jinanense]MDC3959989.1 SRPBCC family protein [Polyangium jinanense]MDC3986207.1 SRPBCC family protein [Polyangium jinanense]
MIDIMKELYAVHRETGPKAMLAGEGRTVKLRRSYDAEIEDVWDAITNPERIRRWFLPLEGELRLGGHYQLKGNAGGKILRCDPPRLLEVTWSMGPKDDESSKVEVRLSVGEGDQTILELEHAAIVPPGMWSEYGPGAVGVGWDLTLLGLSMELRSIFLEDKEAWGLTPEARQFITESSVSWGAANQAAGTSAEDAQKCVENTTKFYAPDPPPAT